MTFQCPDGEEKKEKKSRQEKNETSVLPMQMIFLVIQGGGYKIPEWDFRQWQFSYRFDPTPFSRGFRLFFKIPINLFLQQTYTIKTDKNSSPLIIS